MASDPPAAIPPIVVVPVEVGNDDSLDEEDELVDATELAAEMM